MIDFVFTSVNGNLKLPVKEKVRNRMVFNFNINTEFAENLGIIKHLNIRNFLNLFINKNKIAIEVTEMSFDFSFYLGFTLTKLAHLFAVLLVWTP